jgi:hypothetical protein
VTGIPLLKNWNFSPLFSRRIDEALSRYDEPLYLLNWLPRPTEDPSRLHSYLTPRWWHMADSAVSWLNTSRVFLSNTKERLQLPSTSQRMPWD